MTKEPKEYYCHWCRQIAKFSHVQCCRCPLKYCGRCLLGKQGEDILEETEPDVQWVCPKCRGGCGPGCENCCTCSLCRRAQGLVPVGVEPLSSLIKDKDMDGFSNVHDYLIYLKTGDSKESIARRKDSRRWTKAGRKSKKKSRGWMDSEPSGEYADSQGQTKTGGGEMVEVEITNLVKDDHLGECPENMDCISYPPIDFGSPENLDYGSDPNNGDRSPESMDDRSNLNTRDGSPEIMADGFHPSIFHGCHRTAGRGDGGSDAYVLDGGSDAHILEVCHDGPDSPEFGGGGPEQTDCCISPASIDGRYPYVRNEAPESMNDGSDPKPEEDFNSEDSMAGRDPYEDFANLGLNVFLIKKWFTREKRLVGNELTIMLTGKEVEQAKAIISRSSATAIRYNCDKLLQMEKRLQESTVEKICATIQSDFAQLRGRLAQELEFVYKAIVDQVSSIDGIE